MPAVILKRINAESWDLTAPFDFNLNDFLKTVPGVEWKAATKSRLVWDNALEIVTNGLTNLGCKIIRRGADEAPRNISRSIRLPEKADTPQYQLEGVARILGGSTLLAWEMGAGKTLAVLSGVSHLGLPCLVVCPAHVISTWQRELDKWYGDTGLDITFVSYASVHKVDLPDGFVLVIDEAHKVNKETSRRRKKVEKLAKQADRVVALTGTPMPNNPMELWSLCNLVFPGRLGSKSKFAFRYAGAELQDIPDGSDRKCLHYPAMVDIEDKSVLNVGELARRFGKLAHIVTESDLEHGLPALNIERVSYRPSGSDLAKLRYYDSGMSKTNRSLSLDLAIDIKLQDVDTRGTGNVWAFWRHSSLAKASELLTYCNVPFQIITGKITQKKRDTIIDRLSDHKDLLLCTIDALQTGIDLTARNEVDIFEMVYVPAKIAQFIKRFHRRGQTKDVTVRFHCVEGSTDERVADINMAKIDVIRSVTGGADTEALFEAAFDLDVDAELKGILEDLSL